MTGSRPRTKMDIFSGSRCKFPKRYAALPIPNENEFSVSFDICRNDSSVLGASNIASFVAYVRKKYLTVSGHDEKPPARLPIDVDWYIPKRWLWSICVEDKP